MARVGHVPFCTDADDPYAGRGPRRAPGFIGRDVTDSAVDDQQQLETLTELGSWIVDVRTGTVTCSAALLDVLGIEATTSPLTFTQLFAHARAGDRQRIESALHAAVLVAGSF